MVELNPVLAPLAFLVGTWRGTGEGHYPTIEDFAFEEELMFWHLGGGFLAHIQKTWSPADRSPLHSEQGYWKIQPTGVELVVAHSFAVVEIGYGSPDGHSITIESRDFAKTTSAKTIDAATRRYSVDGNLMSITVDMEFGGHPMQHHLDAELKRVG
ncbi:MAG: FABP family protein [Actinomycetota bacterium]